MSSAVPAALCVAVACLAALGCTDDPAATDSGATDASATDASATDAPIPDADLPDAPEPLAPYGGEIILEHTPRFDGGALLRATAFFVDAHDGEHPPIASISDDPDSPACINFDTTPGLWPFSAPAGEHTVDVGASVSLLWGGGELMLARQPAAQPDLYGRTHDVWYQFSESPSTSITESMFGTNFTLQLPTGGTPYDDIVDGALYMPPEFTVTEPPTNTNVEIVLGSSWEARWELIEPPAELPGNADRVAAIVAFLALDNDTMLLTVRSACAATNQGRMVIPAEVLADIPSSGIVLVENSVHNPALSADGRLVHFVGRNNRLATYTTRAP